ncbi:hypothetical protein E2C01_097058 [Portunus trituberculatus]|uniref:Uncharacterized protein n=1 Tax=Portunus trituberculatus TaxID=210409 RepID=A0A5B7K3L9_PORTR|nr:hypothetical protein [Portunus trituberculatus]
MTQFYQRQHDVFADAPGVPNPPPPRLSAAPTREERTQCIIHFRERHRSAPRPLPPSLSKLIFLL